MTPVSRNMSSDSCNLPNPPMGAAAASAHGDVALQHSDTPYVDTALGTRGGMNDGSVVVATEGRDVGNARPVEAQDTNPSDADSIVRPDPDGNLDHGSLDGSTAVLELKQTDTVVDSETSEERFYADLQGQDLALVLATGYVVQQRRGLSFLASLSDEPHSALVPGGGHHELMGMGAHLGKYFIHAYAEADVDENLDPLAMKQLFEPNSDYDVQETTEATSQET